jgi:hypothetical protein
MKFQDKTPKITITMFFLLRVSMPLMEKAQ